MSSRISQRMRRRRNQGARSPVSSCPVNGGFVPGLRDPAGKELAGDHGNVGRDGSGCLTGVVSPHDAPARCPRPRAAQRQDPAECPGPPALTH